MSTSTPIRNPQPSGECCDDKASCCKPAAATVAADASASAERVREQVREGYGKIARTGVWTVADATGAPKGGSCCGPAAAAGTQAGSGGGCCGGSPLDPEQVAVAVGYSQGELAAIPDGANMGLSCGNPTAIASLRPGEVVLDLGAGGGFDCFVAGPKVGPTGRVIGVDMTADMVSRARRNTESYRKHSGLDNVEFRLGEIENLPVADASVDVVISNCVLNLSPDKPRVWREIARVLKRGGRVAVSDLALLRPLPEAVRADVEALVGCVAGAVLVEEMRAMIAAAGLKQIELTAKPGYIDSMTDRQDPLYRRIIAALPEGARPSDYITSLDISARNE